MSQVKFASKTKDGTEVTVVGGWDRPLREFFLNVFDSVEDDPVWSDLSLLPSKKQDTKVIRAKLVELGVVAPEGFWATVEKREANVMHEWTGTEWNTTLF